MSVLKQILNIFIRILLIPFSVVAGAVYGVVLTLGLICVFPVAVFVGDVDDFKDFRSKL